jgi:flagellar basal body-associated protein FliL
MADEPIEAGGVDDGESGKKRKLPKTLIIVVAVTIAEAAAFFLIFNYFGGGPEVVHGEGSHAAKTTEGKDAVGLVEVELLRNFKVPNDKSGHVYIYDMDISVLVPTDDKAEIETLVAERSAQLADRIALIIRAASDRVMKEDDLRALKTQLQKGLALIIEDEDVVREVLIPRMVPIRSD